MAYRRGNRKEQEGLLVQLDASLFGWYPMVKNISPTEELMMRLASWWGCI
ncbi:MAG: hypothetical protein AB7E08_05570 [Candidatus Omnitrophota bacterium]